MEKSEFLYKRGETNLWEICIFFAYLFRGAPLLEYGQAESPVQHPGGGEDHHRAGVVDVRALLFGKQSI